jgi:hypothetical protein
MRRVVSCVLVLGLCFALAGRSPVYATELVTNGGFETGTLTGWSASGDAMVGYGIAYSGWCSCAATDGTLWQTLATTAGQEYDISFYLGTFPGASNATVTWDSTALLSATLPGPVDFTKYSYTMVATSNSTTLTFDLNSECAVFLDDVSVTEASAVPEPAFYQLGSLLALGGLGALRMRKRS